MTDLHPNVTRLMESMQAWAEEGDTEAVESLIAEDAVWHVSGNNPLSGEYRGRRAVLDYVARTDQSEVRIEQDNHDILGSDDHVVMLATTRAEAPDGDTLENRAVFVMRFVDGQIVEQRSYSWDQYAVDAFWNKHLKP